MVIFAWILALVGFLIVCCAVAWSPWRRSRRRGQFLLACHQFHLRREPLEHKFLQIAGSSGKPRGLRWADCDFADDITYARDRISGQLSALVSITIRFEAIEGGGMEEVEAVSNLRAATAVFQYEKGAWLTQGRALFNLNPAEAVQYYQANLELVAHEAAHSGTHS